MFIKFFVYLFFLIFLFTSCKKGEALSTPASYEYNTLGSSANDLLSDKKFTSIDIQIQYMPGFAPSDSATNVLTNFLNNYLHKPVGIRVLTQQVVSAGKNILTLDEIGLLEKKSRSVFTQGDKISVYILITDGSFNLSDALARAYWNTSFCIFGQALNNNSGGAGQINRNILLARLFEHEFGHLLGLVDRGTPMQTNHKDQNNGAHCDNNACLMYYTIETTVGNNLNSIPSLDNNCKLDLQANGGK